MTDDDFVAMIRNSARWHGVRVLAEKLRVSVPTIERWWIGKNLPHDALRDGICGGAAIPEAPARDSNK